MPVYRNSSSVAPGTVAHYAANAIPTGWLKCNGAAVSRATYAGLFAVIGTTYGVGDGSTTFNLPDLRGEFLRGLDDGRGVDTGRGIGTAQAQSTQPHTHTVNAPGNSTNGGVGGWWAGNGTGVAAVETANNTGTETRPRNVAMLACIKF